MAKFQGKLALTSPPLLISYYNKYWTVLLIQSNIIQKDLRLPLFLYVCPGFKFHKLCLNLLRKWKILLKSLIKIFLLKIMCIILKILLQGLRIAEGFRYAMVPIYYLKCFVYVKLLEAELNVNAYYSNSIHYISY